jgi:hypothetical protein
MGRLAVQPPNRVQRFKDNIGQLVYASGGSPTVNLPQNDYTTALELISAQQVVSGASVPVIAGYGAFGPLGLVQVALPGGRTPYSLPGYVGDIYSRIRSAPYASQLTSSPLSASTTTTWLNPLRIPLTLTDDTERGAWYTGDTTVQMKLVLQCASPAQVFSTVNGATIQGSWTVIREFFNAPPPQLSAVWLDAISWYHEVQQVASTTLANGSITIDLQRDVDYQRIFFVFYTGNDTDGTFAPADGLYTSIDLGIDTTIHPFNTIPELSIRFEDLETYNTILPAGTAVLDFERIKDSVRDILPTDTDTVTILRLTIAAPSASNKVDVYTERVSDNPYAAKWIAMAQQQGGAATAA